MAPSIPPRNIARYLETFSLQPEVGTAGSRARSTTRLEKVEIEGRRYPRYTNEFWTARQRQACSLHEVSYRACFKPQFPRFMIELLTIPGDVVYDPFSGRGTTVIEAALLGRAVVANDINPLSTILSRPRLSPPDPAELQSRLAALPIDDRAEADIDLSMFYHSQTLGEILSLRAYLERRKRTGQEDRIDEWIRMVATNRLTGHSKGFFSVYTLPPNQAVLPGNQVKINKRLGQTPEYRDTKELIRIKTKSLLRGVSAEQAETLRAAARHACWLTADARRTSEIPDGSVQLTITSPPFLDIVQYADDNWLRCWFNAIDVRQVARTITMSSNIDEWKNVMADVLRELYRVTKPGGWVAFEVGEVRNGKIRLDEIIVPLGLQANFECRGILVNQQAFTKTANIWGIRNNHRGTNTNRIVLFRREK